MGNEHQWEVDWAVYIKSYKKIAATKSNFYRPNIGFTHLNTLLQIFWTFLDHLAHWREAQARTSSSLTDLTGEHGDQVHGALSTTSWTVQGSCLNQSREVGMTPHVCWPLYYNLLAFITFSWLRSEKYQGSGDDTACKQTFLPPLPCTPKKYTSASLSQFLLLEVAPSMSS